ncbi:MAG: hypothetical protein QME16_00170 [Planctomycetota bacterium]|nr:hypothetical protein [Planctomycetota bacterium]
MGGCNWQEKTFSVAVSETRVDCLCVECKSETQGQYKYNDDILCKECFNKKSVKSRGIGLFHTDKDLSYNFTTELFGKPITIHSKGQFKSLLKHHNLADASIKECHQEANFRKRLNAESDIIKRRESAERIMEKHRGRLKFRR